MKTLSKKYRATLIDGTASECWTEPCTGFTFAPDDVPCFEADTLQELQQLAAAAGVELDDGQVNALPPPSAPSLEDYERAVEDVLQECAAAHRYDDIVSACSYAAVANPFQEESAAILQWRGNVWAWCYGLLADSPATLPTLAEFRASLLAAWPMP